MSSVIELPFKVDRGRLPSAVLTRLGEAVATLDGKRLVLVLKEQKRRRSLNQNAYYWGVVIPAITQMFREHGNYVDGEEVHEFLKLRVGKLAQVYVTPDGEVLKGPGSTAKLSTIEFEGYLEQVRAWAAGYGVVVPLPNEEVS